MIPFYLKNHLTDIKEKKDKTKGVLISSAGNTELEIYYYGGLVSVGRAPYICDGELPCLIVAKDHLTQEKFVVFDGLKHGYNAMFCNESVADCKRDLELYDYRKGKIAVTFGYGIDYDEEKEEYEFNDKNEIKLIDGTYLDFEKAKSIGFDWITIKFLKKNRKIADFELA
ncbi:MAG: hypothetical protein J1G01_03265 [Clostridiales bacterium]|nr:hypothetical protein [Clostridiales bacterium]